MQPSVCQRHSRKVNSPVRQESPFPSHSTVRKLPHPLTSLLAACMWNASPHLVSLLHLFAVLMMQPSSLHLIFIIKKVYLGEPHVRATPPHRPASQPLYALPRRYQHYAPGWIRTLDPPHTRKIRYQLYNHITSTFR